LNVHIPLALPIFMVHLIINQERLLSGSGYS
jgi:hypothetical protein